MNTSIIPVQATPIIRQADNDQQLVAMWLFGRSPATTRAYRADADRFLRFVGKRLPLVTLRDLQAFQGSLAELSTASQARTLASIKSLFSFAYEAGYIQFNPARVIRLPKVQNTLAERIMSEKQVLRMVDTPEVETRHERRNRVLVLLGYAAGLRVSELCGLCWKQAQERGEGEGQVTVHGKGGKTRAVRIPASVWADLVGLRGDARDEDPVFASREGGHLDTSSAWRVVKAAAKKARAPKGVSPHWLRHAHASHALERGANVALVAATLGHGDIKVTSRYTHARPNESSSRFLPL